MTVPMQTIPALLRKKPFLIAISLCIAGFLLFGVVIGNVLDGGSHALDTRLLLSLRDQHDSANPWGPLWFQEMIRDFTGLGGTGVLSFITLASAFYLLAIRKAGIALYVVCAVESGMIFSNAMKAFFDRPRPDLVPHDSIPLSASLPSGHSLMSTVVYLTIAALLAEIQPSRNLRIYILTLAALIAVVVGVSRVYLGVHWPSDVLAGWIGGASWALMCWIIAHSIRKKF